MKNPYLQQSILFNEAAESQNEMVTNDAVTIDLGYKPRPLQAWIHSRLQRFNILVLHRRFGKTVLTGREIVNDGLNNPLHNPQYAYIAPTFKAAKRIAWEYMKEFTKGLKADYNETEMRIKIMRPQGDHITIWLLGAMDVGDLKGIYLDGCVMDEYAQIDPQIWRQAIRPALSDRKGWAIFIGTPLGMNHFYTMYEAAQGRRNWFTCIIRASESGVIDPEELIDCKKDMSDEEYNQEYECSFTASMAGAYYTKYMADTRKEGRICELPYNPSYPVYTAWDIGMNDTTAIWFYQLYDNYINVIDYYEDSGQDASFYAAILNSKPYKYAQRGHNIPHDAGQKDWGTGLTKQETLEEHGLLCNVLEKTAIQEGINMARMIFPKTRFDKKNCHRGLICLEAYTKKWDSKNQTYSSTPLHNWASNGADGFRYMAMAVGKTTNRPERKNLLQYRQALGFDPLGDDIDRNRQRGY